MGWKNSWVAMGWCVAAVCASAQVPDQLPMYGGQDRSAIAELRDADRALIEKTSQHYGSREKASDAFVGNGFGYYERDDLANAMRRFNQAWLLNPDNPDVYFGFGVVLHDKGQHCEAVKQFDRADSFGREVQGMRADFARVLVLCAVNAPSMTEAERAAMFQRSDDMYRDLIEKSDKKAYVYSSMATARYWRGQYAQAWAAVRSARALGGNLPERFLAMLREKMPEPQ